MCLYPLPFLVSFIPSSIFMERSWSRRTKLKRFAGSVLCQLMGDIHPSHWLGAKKLNWSFHLFLRLPVSLLLQELVVTSSSSIMFIMLPQLGRGKVVPLFN